MVEKVPHASGRKHAPRSAHRINPPVHVWTVPQPTTPTGGHPRIELKGVINIDTDVDQLYCRGVFSTNAYDVGSGVGETPPIDIRHLRAGTLPFTESDEQIKAALEDVSVPALIAAIVQTTGDPTLLRGPIRPRRFVPNDFQGGLEDDERRELRSLAFDVLRDFREGGLSTELP